MHMSALCTAAAEEDSSINTLRQMVLASEIQVPLPLRLCLELRMYEVISRGVFMSPHHRVAALKQLCAGELLTTLHCVEVS